MEEEQATNPDLNLMGTLERVTARASVFFFFCRPLLCFPAHLHQRVGKLRAGETLAVPRAVYWNHGTASSPLPATRSTGTERGDTRPNGYVKPAV